MDARREKVEMTGRGVWNVVYYETESGESPVEEWLDSLQARERAAMMRLVGRLRDYGVLLRWPDVAHIDGKLWELRAEFGGRVFYFAHIGRTFVLLHGYRKKSQKSPLREIEIAMRRLDDVCRRGIDG